MRGAHFQSLPRVMCKSEFARASKQADLVLKFSCESATFDLSSTHCLLKAKMFHCGQFLQISFKGETKTKGENKIIV